MRTTYGNYFIIGLLFVCFTSFKQVSDIKQLALNSNNTLIKTTYLLSKDSTGYINDIFLPARINNSKKTFNIRYNTYKDEMEIEENDAIYFLPKNVGFTINFQNINKVYQVFRDSLKNKKSYFVLLFKGNKLSLLLKEKIDVQTRFIARKGYVGYLPPTFKHLKGKLYVGYKNNTSQRLPRKKKDILKLFSYKSKEVELFAKKNNYRFKKQKDLIELFKFYNSLK
ncbi:hypothetical protein [Lutibacter sp.]|uniref:hypothetical protein n=1 Tax=Lutibacter sp. TaxID=1925666 RepID=UPI0025C64993|nr:hypothetical protein [Lutibacter sp.]MCF6168873.1 hypothetical protein [Lutibacter sp.]